MSFLQYAEKFKNKNEIVVCDSIFSSQAHRELFHLNEDLYLILGRTEAIFDSIMDILDFCDSSISSISKLHLALGWENLLRVSLWQTTMPGRGETFTLLRNAGITSQELQPFIASDINDIFPYLYYGKRFDVLKRICNEAKRQTENHLRGRSIRVICHLIADDTKMIIASSL